MMYGMQYIQQTIVGIDGSEARFFGYVADNSEEMEPDLSLIHISEPTRP